MERGKRASMREGPLAALFRKTEDEGLEPRPEQKPEAQRAERAEFGQTPEPRGGMPIPAPDHSQEPLPSGDSRLEELRPAPPSARTAQPEPAPAVEEERRPRTPEQRLRDVFSHDIPENIMELSPSSDRDVQPRFGREEPRVPVDPAPVLQPVLRVVGVGGAGV